MPPAAADLAPVPPLPELLKRAKKLKAGAANGTDPDVRAAGGDGANAVAMFSDIQTRSKVSQDGKRFNINFVPKQFQLGPLFGGRLLLEPALTLEPARVCHCTAATCMIVWAGTERAHAAWQCTVKDAQ